MSSETEPIQVQGQQQGGQQQGDDATAVGMGKSPYASPTEGQNPGNNQNRKPGEAKDAPAQYESHLQVKNLQKSFGSSQVMKNINFDFAANSITTVLGPSGTGKSVLIKHLVGLLEPDSGEVLVDGEDIWSMTEDERYAMRTRFGVCWQDGALFGSMNIYDNTAFPLRTHTKMSESEIEDKVMNLLEEVGLGHSAHKAPNEISGGMKKRAGFARALVMDPEFVIFDEPDSGLDPVRTALLCDIILDVHSKLGGTYLLVTHDMATAKKVSDYIGLIWKGEVVHYGPAKEAFENEDPFVKQFLAGESAGPLGMD